MWDDPKNFKDRYLIVDMRLHKTQRTFHRDLDRINSHHV